LAGEAHQPVAPSAKQIEPGKEERPSGTAKTEAPPKKVPVPSVRDPLPPDLEREIESALGDAALDELVSSGPTEDIGELLEMDSRHLGTVAKIHGDNVFFSLGGRNQGVASLRQFKEPPLVGAQAEVVVSGINAEDGLYELIVPGASVQVHDWSDLVEGTVVEARITGSNTGGLECMVGSVRGFIPASQIEMYHVDNYAEYYDKKLPCVVTEANRRRRNLVLSHRAVLEREKEEQRKQRLEELEIGQVVEGVVSSIRDFGAFVDIGGLDGLVHVSRLSWERVEHPSEVLEVGQKVRVKVEKVNPQTGKISLTYRDLLEHPWTDIEQRFPENSIVTGTVTRTAQFGAFVKLAPGVEGLVHISELAHHRVVQVANVVKEGDEIEVKVLSVDPEAQRMSLSLKEAHALPEPGEPPAGEEQSDKPAPEPTVPKRSTPLKGGTDRSTGGDEFGLKW
jgi:small subunit ribosomal protein S1